MLELSIACKSERIWKTTRNAELPETWLQELQMDATLVCLSVQRIQGLAKLSISIKFKFPDFILWSMKLIP
jgi:hypothetical protein